MERRVRWAIFGGRGPELDAIVAPILSRLGPIGWLGVDHDGVVIAEKLCGRVEGRKGGARKAHRGFLKDATDLWCCAGGEGDILEKLLAVVAKRRQAVS
jgi:hypothetical protein